MGYASGYGLAVTSWVQMAVMCYSGQNLVDRVTYFSKNADQIHIDIQYLRNTILHSIRDRMIILSMCTTISNGIYCQQPNRNIF